MKEARERWATELDLGVDFDFVQGLAAGLESWRTTESGSD